ncbi:MAG: ComEC/Rec2 family competence protein [Oscillospiraceae bacterium]|jgi:ComEC/Rec2-related protein|nr:ComEC/Rec2 family competence protein [Oscillospiraceae bacterium]
MARPFAVLGFSMLLVGAALTFAPGWLTWAMLAVGFIGCVAATCVTRFGRGEGKRHARVIALACFACALISALQLLQTATAYTPALRLAGKNLQIQARVLSLPEARYGRYYYECELLSINGSKQKPHKFRFSGRVPLYAKPYDEISYTGDLAVLGEQDTKALENYRAKGVYLSSYAAGFGEDAATVIPKHSRHPMKLILGLRAAILRNIDTHYAQREAALLRGMLLGDADALDYQTQQDFRAAGIAHLFAVSGVHMSLLSYSVFRALLALRCPRRPSAILCGAFVLLFMAVTGFSPSCVRAGIMMLVVMAGECAGRMPDSRNSLGLAAVILMLASPLSAGQAGLELSFCATGGILLFHKRLCGPVDAWAKRSGRFLPTMLHRAWSALAVSLSAMTLTLPILLLRFPGKVLWITPLANLLLVPLGGALLLLGGLFTVTQLSVFHVLSEPLANALLWGTSFLSRLRVPSFSGGHGLVAVGIGVALLFCAVLLVLRYIGKPFTLRGSAGILGALLFVTCWLPGFLQRDDLRLRLLDTGAGVSVLLSQGNRAALFGCGGDQLPAAAAKNALAELGIRELQLLLLPGESESLSAGAGELLRSLPVQKALCATQNAEAESYAVQYAATQSDFSILPLWEGARGIYYKDAAGGACLLELRGTRVLLLFNISSPNLPTEWWEADYFMDLRRSPGELCVNRKGRVRIS